MNQQTVPFNTGRMLIGSRFVIPPKPIEHNEDMLCIQSWVCPPSKRLQLAERQQIVRAWVDALCWSGALALLTLIPLAPQLWATIAN